MSVIKIGIACHKLSELPKMDLYLPIRVGAALANEDFGMQRDDDGDNISEKNKEYCELTAQYWLWKNVDADYYGLCHYRRYLNFADVPSPKNERNQIIAPILDEESKNFFRLEDEDLIRKEIESNDLIVGELQEVKKLDTPLGNQKTAYNHWIAHNRLFIMKKDLDKMLEILDELYPEIGFFTREYLNGPFFTGFNCFIANKAIFDELCQIEFSVLRELEKYVDFYSYSQQMSRIYGFMGEIISSSFFYYIEKSGKYKVKHVPLIYFEHTDPVSDFFPITNSNPEDVIPVLFNMSDTPLYKFGTIWRSFLDNTDSKYYYDVLLMVNNPEKELLKLYKLMSNDYPNISLRIYDVTYYRIRFGNKYRFDYKNKNNDEYIFSILPFIPYLLNNYKKMIVVNENNLFCDSIVDLWKENKDTSTIISAPDNLYVQSMVNGIVSDTEKYLSGFLSNPLNYFSVNIFIWDFALFRKKFTETDVSQAYIKKNSSNHIRSKEEILNLLCEKDISFIDIRWATWLNSNENLAYQLSFAQADKVRKMSEARKKPGIVTYTNNDLMSYEPDELYFLFWKTANKIPSLLPLYLQRYCRFSMRKRIKRKIIDKITESKLLPSNSPQRKIAKKIYNKLFSENKLS